MGEPGSEKRRLKVHSIRCRSPFSIGTTRLRIVIGGNASHLLQKPGWIIRFRGRKPAHLNQVIGGIYL